MVASQELTKLLVFSKHVFRDDQVRKMQGERRTTNSICTNRHGDHHNVLHKQRGQDGAIQCLHFKRPHEGHKRQESSYLRIAKELLRPIECRSGTDSVQKGVLGGIFQVATMGHGLPKEL